MSFSDFGHKPYTERFMTQRSIQWPILLVATVALTAFAGELSGQTANHAPSRIVHHFTPKSTIIEQGDTITWIHTTPADSSHRAVQSVSVYLLQRDTVMLLGKYGPRPVAPYYARAIRHLVTYAREQDELEKKLGHSP